MAITRAEKEEKLKKLEEKISQAKFLVFVGYSGFKIREQEELRKLLKKEKSELFITKKKLLNLVLSKFKFEKLEELRLEKEAGLVLGYEDEITPIKNVFNFSSEHENLKIKGGIFEKKIVTLEEIKFLANLPSKQVLQTQLVANLQSPINRLVNALQGNLRSLINIFDILSQKT